MVLKRPWVPAGDSAGWVGGLVQGSEDGLEIIWDISVVLQALGASLGVRRGHYGVEMELGPAAYRDGVSYL